MHERRKRKRADDYALSFPFSVSGQSTKVKWEENGRGGGGWAAITRAHADTEMCFAT